MRVLRGLTPTLELPGRIVRLWRDGDDVVAIMEDGRSVKVSGLDGRGHTKQ